MNPKEAYDWGLSKEGVSAARRYLSAPKQKEAELLLLYARLDHLKKITVPSLGWQDAPAGSHQGDPTGNTAVRLCDTEREIHAVMQELKQMKEEREEMIQDIADPEIQTALRLHYLEQLSSVAAGMRMYLDERQYFRKVHKGLEQVAMRLFLRERENLRGQKKNDILI